MCVSVQFLNEYLNKFKKKKRYYIFINLRTKDMENDKSQSHNNLKS